MVVTGSSRLTLPALICCFRAVGSASASTLRPTDSAVLGETPDPTPPFFSPAMALCSCSASPQNASIALWVHVACANLLLLPLGTHLGLALGHHFGLTDRLIHRMLPRRRTGLR